MDKEFKIISMKNPADDDFAIDNRTGKQRKTARVVEVTENEYNHIFKSKGYLIVNPHVRTERYIDVANLDGVQRQINENDLDHFRARGFDLPEIIQAQKIAIQEAKIAPNQNVVAAIAAATPRQKKKDRVPQPDPLVESPPTSVVAPVAVDHAEAEDSVFK